MRPKTPLSFLDHSTSDEPYPHHPLLSGAAPRHVSSPAAAATRPSAPSPLSDARPPSPSPAPSPADRRTRHPAPAGVPQALRRPERPPATPHEASGRKRRPIAPPIRPG